MRQRKNYQTCSRDVCLVVLPLILAAFAATPAFAADKLWLIDNGDFLVDANWGPAGVPVAGDDAVISESITSNLNPAAPAPITFHQLYVGGTLDHGGATNPGGTFNHSAGAIHLAGAQSWMVVADKPGLAGTYNLSGSGSIVVDDDFMTIGQHGTGFLNVSGNGSIDTRGLILGRWGDPGNGTGTLKDNGSITTRGGGFTLGQQGIGTFTQSSGAVNVTGAGYGSWAFIGGHDESTGPRTGTYNMDGGTFKAQERIQIAQGPGSTGTFNQTAGDVTAGTRNPDNSAGPEGFVEIGQGGVGTYNLSGGTLTAVRSLVVGSWAGGDGRFNITGGTVNIGEALQVARGSTDPANPANPKAGLVDQTGGVVNATWTEIGTNRFLGQTFVGTYKLSGTGVLNTQFEMNVGRNNGEGVFEMSGGTVNVGLGAGQRTFNVGRGGKGTFAMSGGTINLPEGFNLGSIEGNIVGTGTGTQTGGTINTNWVSVGQHGPASYAMSGGQINASGDFNVGDVLQAGPAGSSAVLSLSGSAVINTNHLFVGKGGTTVGVVNQTGGTMKVGSLGVSIADQAGSTGTYNLQGGVLDGGSENTLSFGAGTAAFNMTGGTLKNFKSTNFTLDNKGGRVIVGDVGTVTAMAIAGNYSQTKPAALQIDIRNEFEYDTLTASGSVAVAGNLTIDKDPGFAALGGQVFNVVTGVSRTGHFDTITNNVAAPGLRFVPRYTPTAVQLIVALGGDANLDQVVNFVDFQRLEINFGLPDRTWGEGDFTGDGMVDIDDFKVLYDNYGQVIFFPPAAASPGERAALDAMLGSVPEPTTAGVLAVAALGTLLRRRRSN